MDRRWMVGLGAVVLVLVLALIAVQCAGDDDADVGAGVTTTSEAGSEVDETTTTSEAPPTTTSEANTTTTEPPVTTTTTATMTTTTSAGFDAGDSVVLAAGGLVVGGTDFDFDTPGIGVTGALIAVLGTPSDQGEQENCPAGPATYAAWGPDGLSLTLQDGAFVGWSARPSSILVTATGIGTGFTVGELRAAHPSTSFEATSLGAEFDADGIFGLATDDSDAGTISDMWAGITCIFR